MQNFSRNYCRCYNRSDPRYDGVWWPIISSKSCLRYCDWLVCDFVLFFRIRCYGGVCLCECRWQNWFYEISQGNKTTSRTRQFSGKGFLSVHWNLYTDLRYLNNIGKMYFHGLWKCWQEILRWNYVINISVFIFNHNFNNICK